ncbi:MAG TPA: hypothetical protein VLE70_19610 [Anaerolineae bacterium]|nr:hypothetical protein [Anaerolineae bacterium]
MRSLLRFLTITIPVAVFVLSAVGGSTAATAALSTSACDYWVAPPPAGDDTNPGTQADPWATLQHAAETIPDAGCTVWFESGTYVGENQIEARFQTLATFKAIIPYSAILENGGPTLSLKGARNLLFEGFEIRHSPQAAAKHVIETARKTGTSTWTENVIFRDNIIHDSYNNDLMKIHNGSRFITVEGNVFYNQATGEQHLDVNSVTDVVIQDNLFFNDFAGSGRQNNNDTKHFIVVKDANEGEDGLEGSERVTIRRNVFLNWEGELVTFMQIGNDGKAFHEAEDVMVENNLLIGNSANAISAPLGIRGAKNVTLRNNTIVGDLPAKAYGIRAEIIDLNPQNQNIFLYNNIWADPTGTMGAEGPGDNSHEFSNGDPAQSSNVILDNNLYWNGNAAIPPGDLVSPLVDDANRVVGDPLLNTNHGSITLPRWNGVSFASGNTSVRDEFIRLVVAYGQIPAGSPAGGQADPANAPGDDILGRSRSAGPELGAYEYVTGPGGTATPTPTNTPPPTATSTPLPTATNTPLPTATNTPPTTATNTPLPTATDTPVPTVTNTPLPTATNTPLPTATNTATPTPTKTPRPTKTPKPTATNTPLPSTTSTPLPTATNTPLPTATNTPQPAATNTPLPTATNTPLPTATGTALPTSTNTPLPTATHTPPPTTTSTPMPTATNTSQPTTTPLPTTTNTPEPTATNAPTATPSPGTTDTGWVGPAANSPDSSGDGNGFEVDPVHGHADDNYLALDVDSGSHRQSSCASNRKDSHHFLDYNFDLPAGVMVSGIEVRLDALVDSSDGSPVMCVQLSWDGGLNWSALQSTPVLTVDESSYLLGGASDTWGHSWTAAELSPTNFRVRIVNAAQSTARDFSLDWLAVKAHYQDDGSIIRTPAVYIPLIISSS